MLLTAIKVVDRDTECCYWQNTCFSDGYVMLLANFEACRISECGGVEGEVGRLVERPIWICLNLSTHLKKKKTFGLRSELKELICDVFEECVVLAD